MRRSLGYLINTLIDDAQVRRYWIADPDGSQLRRLVDRGEEIPDKLLPGRMILSLPAADRELLQTATGKDFLHRWPK